jgi:hypothetical protein
VQAGGQRLAGEHAGVELAVARQVLLGDHELLVAPADGLAGGPAEHRLGRGVPDRHRPVALADDDGVGRRAQQRPDPPPDAAQRALVRAALGDVLVVGDERRGVARAAADRAGRDADFAHLAVRAPRPDDLVETPAPGQRGGQRLLGADQVTGVDDVLPAARAQRVDRAAGDARQRRVDAQEAPVAA